MLLLAGIFWVVYYLAIHKWNRFWYLVLGSPAGDAAITKNKKAKKPKTYRNCFGISGRGLMKAELPEKTFNRKQPFFKASKADNKIHPPVF